MFVTGFTAMASGPDPVGTVCAWVVEPLIAATRTMTAGKNERLRQQASRSVLPAWITGPDLRRTLANMLWMETSGWRQSLHNPISFSRKRAAHPYFPNTY